MRGVQDADGYAAEVFAAHGCAADNAWARARDVAEGAAERAQAPPAGLERDLGDGELGISKQRGRPLDASREQIPMRRDAKSLLERSSEMSRGDAAHTREPRDRPLLVRSRIHAVFRAQQAAQQLGILVFSATV